MTVNHFNGTQQVIDINGSGGAFVSILATGPLRRFKIYESLLKADGTTVNAPQGLTYTLFDGTQVFELPKADVTVQNQPFPTLSIPDVDDAEFHGWQGNVLGNGPDTPGAGVAPTLATVLAKIRSLSATGTSVIVYQAY